MAEYIERAPLINELNDIREMYRAAKNFNAVSAVDNAIGEVKDAPAADVRPERHGRWERVSDDDQDEGWYFCSECKEEYFNPAGDEEETLPKFCPCCGTKMDGKDRE